MPLTQAGRNYLAGAVVANPATLFNNANARIGVGNGSTAFADTQTDLVGASKFRQGMEATFPTIATNVITFKSSFGPNDGNFAWSEWGIFNAASGGTMLCRKVESNGTKTAGQTWIFEVQITVNIGA